MLQRMIQLAVTVVACCCLLIYPVWAFAGPSTSRQTDHGVRLLRVQKHQASSQQSLSVDGSPRTSNKPTAENHHKQDFRRLEARLTKHLLALAQDYNMLQANDHIMVCVSGGKDSAVLLLLLRALQERFATTTPFSITAVHLDQGQPGYDGTALFHWLDTLDIPYHIVHEDTYSIVMDKTPSGNATSYCSLCSRLRRGVLYTTAHSLGCNKIALGHHGDDAVETLVLNMLHGGTLKSMPPRYYASSKDLHVIRPLLLCREADLAAYVEQYNTAAHSSTPIPILPCTLCGSQPVAQRAQVKAWIEALSALTPHPDNLVRALTHVQPATLMDPKLRIACGLDPVTGQAMRQQKGDAGKATDQTVLDEDEEALGF